MSDIEKVDKFLTDAEVFYLASVTEENKPKCRPSRKCTHRLQPIHMLKS